MSELKGYTDGHEFRVANRYIDTQQLFEELGLSIEVENRTPTVGVNVAHLARMPSVQALASEFSGRSLQVVVLGISTAEGPRDFQKLLKGLGANHISTTAIDISDGIFDEIQVSGLDEVVCLQKDARDTGLPKASQDINLRDHIGNCCPPSIDRSIDKEAARILKPGGIAVVNITTSDDIHSSIGRNVIRFESLRNIVGNVVMQALQSGIYDLEEAKALFPDMDFEMFRGQILEIEPNGSFVVFGEDKQGHGEWFRTIEDHEATWQNDGFEIVGMATRKGVDSHEPPLQCVRHNVILRKSVNSLGKTI